MKRLALIVLLATAGCSGSDEEPREPAAAAPAEVRTTRVQVVEGLGQKGDFDPTALYDRLSPGVVTVLSIFEEGGASLLRPRGDDDEGGQGSGFVLDSEGRVATNAHVVTTGEGRERKRAKEVYVEFSDGNRVRAEIVGDDPNSDVALLQIDPKGLDLTPLELGDSKDVKVGAPVAAIGSPFGERQSLSIGVISAVDRTIQSLTRFQIGDAIQTDAAINPGNSGGPLLNGAGEVVGINSQIRTTSEGGQGVGFAVPVDTVRRSLRDLREKGKVEPGYLGVTSQPLYPQLARRLDLGVSTGALIVQVEDGSPADEAGLETGGDKIEFQGVRDIPSEGDVIVSVDGKRLTRRSDLADLVSQRDAGEKVRLGVIRDGKRQAIEVELGKRPSLPPARP